MCLRVNYPSLPVLLRRESKGSPRTFSEEEIKGCLLSFCGGLYFWNPASKGWRATRKAPHTVVAATVIPRQGSNELGKRITSSHPPVAIPPACSSKNVSVERCKIRSVAQRPWMLHARKKETKTDFYPVQRFHIVVKMPYQMIIILTMRVRSSVFHTMGVKICGS